MYTLIPRPPPLLPPPSPLPPPPLFAQYLNPRLSRFSLFFPVPPLSPSTPPYSPSRTTYMSGELLQLKLPSPVYVLFPFFYSFFIEQTAFARWFYFFELFPISFFLCYQFIFFVVLLFYVICVFLVAIFLKLFALFFFMFLRGVFMLFRLCSLFHILGLGHRI
jgi:hypothetical protein